MGEQTPALENKLFLYRLTAVTGFPSGSLVKNSPASAGNEGPIPGGEDPLEKEMATHSRILV